MTGPHHSRIIEWIEGYLSDFQDQIPPQLKLKVEVTENERNLSRLTDEKLEEMFSDLMAEVQLFLEEARENKAIQASKTLAFPPNLAGDVREFALVVVTLDYWEYYYDDLAFVNMEDQKDLG